MNIDWEGPDGTGWNSAELSKPAAGVVVDVWMRIPPSPRTRGMGDEFGVPEAWYEGGTWLHTYRGKPAELDGSYVSHWRETQPGALAFGPGWGRAEWARAQCAQRRDRKANNDAPVSTSGASVANVTARPCGDHPW